jgi:hypothetical protein
MAWRKLGNEVRRVTQRMAPGDDRPGKGDTTTPHPAGKPVGRNSNAARDDRADKGRRSHSRGAAPGRPQLGPGGGASRKPAAGQREAGRRLEV